MLEGTNENVVVWYNFNTERSEVLAITFKYYPSRTVYEQSGNQSNLPPRDDWETVSNSVTLAQYQSASAAIELVYASVNVYLSPSTSYANYAQSKDVHADMDKRKLCCFTIYRYRVHPTIRYGSV